MKTVYHTPVMLDESVVALKVHPEGDYVDATFGGGGHSLAILEKIKGGRLIAFDRDSDAMEEAERIKHRSFSFIRSNFKYIKKYLKVKGISKVNGMILDLGVSSHQLDIPERGFTIRGMGGLDMRMDKHTSLIASEVLNQYTAETLQHILSKYGDVRYARRLAEDIVKKRSYKAFEKNIDLIDVVRRYAIRGREMKYQAQVFQALRIEVNKEMDALEQLLNQSKDIIERGGRLVVISYHSVEDRLVKNFIQHGNVSGERITDIYGNADIPFKAVYRKPIQPSSEEIRINNRSRSAKMRCAERI